VALILAAACGGPPTAPAPPSSPANHAEAFMTPTRDVKEIASRMRRLFAERGLAPTMDESDGHFSAVLDVSVREIDGGPYVIDRRPNRPHHRIESEIAGPRGFSLDVSLTPMLPQIVTQYSAPPSPRGGIFQQLDNHAPDGTHLSTSMYFAPERFGGADPFLVVELQTGLEVPADFARRRARPDRAGSLGRLERTSSARPDWNPHVAARTPAAAVPVAM
jgi:hypothetical protein